uniref:Cl2727_2b n=1 Tax=Arundo donax TaxID=35708 RepID=A0A0A9E7U6_ARUDO
MGMQYSFSLHTDTLNPVNQYQSTISYTECTGGFDGNTMFCFMMVINKVPVI